MCGEDGEGVEVGKVARDGEDLLWLFDQIDKKIIFPPIPSSHDSNLNKQLASEVIFCSALFRAIH